MSRSLRARAAKPLFLGRIEDALLTLRDFLRSWFIETCGRCRMTRSDGLYAGCRCDFANAKQPVTFTKESSILYHASNGYRIQLREYPLGRPNAVRLVWVIIDGKGSSVTGRRTLIQAKEFVRAIHEDRVEMPVGETWPFGWSY